mgnify:CR=1 FL=1
MTTPNRPSPAPAWLPFARKLLHRLREPTGEALPDPGRAGPIWRIDAPRGSGPRRITVGNQSYGYPGDANATEPFRVERAGDGWRVGWSAPHGGRQTTWLPDSLR